SVDCCFSMLVHGPVNTGVAPVAELNTRIPAPGFTSSPASGESEGITSCQEDTSFNLSVADSSRYWSSSPTSSLIEFLTRIVHVMASGTAGCRRQPTWTPPQ